MLPLNFINGEKDIQEVKLPSLKQTTKHSKSVLLKVPSVPWCQCDKSATRWLAEIGNKNSNTFRPVWHCRNIQLSGSILYKSYQSAMDWKQTKSWSSSWIGWEALLEIGPPTPWYWFPSSTFMPFTLIQSTMLLRNPVTENVISDTDFCQ